MILRLSPLRGRPARTTALVLFTAGSLLTGLIGQAAPVQHKRVLSPAPASPAPVASEVSAEATPAALSPGARRYELPLKQLGALYPLQLRGVDGSNGVPFSIRSDEIVTAARLKLHYAYSPALIPDLSHINVMVNDEVAATVPVPREQAGLNLTRDIAIPPRLITEFNRLNLQLIGHYTMECEDPLHSSLWANISNLSVLELTVAPLALQNDLSLLPLPFFDRRDVRQLNLPFVFANAPGTGMLEAAGTLSSWFGGLAGYRGAVFPVKLGQLPESGHAVVFIAGNEGRNLLPGMALPQVQGPTVAITSNPNDPMTKLLLVMGRDANDLKIAAAALSVGGYALSGPSATITQLNALKPRQPYDAPNWLPSHRAVKFGELAQEKDLNVSGYSPDLVRINMRLPPDLFGWREKGIPVHLKYRYTPRPTADKSTLNVNVSQQYLQSFPLAPLALKGDGKASQWLAKLLPDGTLPVEEDFRIPLFKLSSQAQLQFHFYYDYIKQGACKDVLLDNVKGAIEPDSTVDVSGFSHFLAMPDLAVFSNSGFPFTRLADLSETAVILPDNPSANDYSAYLTMLGKMGDSTGYPATGVTVAQATQVEQFANKDLLVISSGGNQPLLTQWADRMSVSLDGSKRFNISDLVYRLVNWWNPDQTDRLRPRRTELTVSSNSTDAVLTGFESPLSSGRSVVVVSSNRPEGLNNAMRALLDADLVKNIQGSLAIIRGKQVDSLVADQSYYVGRLGPIQYIHWWLSTNPLLLVGLALLSSVLLATLLFLKLRAKARKRLQN